jgi:predicted PurR-regulated permease PerM
MTTSSGENVPRWLATSAGWAWRFIALVVAVVVVVSGIARVQHVFVALFVALVLTSVLEPLTGLYSRVMPRGVAVTLAMLSALIIVGGLMTYVVASVAGQWQGLSDQFTLGIDRIIQWAKDSPLPVNVQWENVSDAVAAGQTWVADHTSEIAGQVAGRFGTFAEGFAVVALAVFTTICFLAGGSKMWDWFLVQLPVRVRDRWNRAAHAGWASFDGYTRGTMLVAATDAILCGIIIAVLRVPLAAPLAVLVFIGAFIPLVGAPIAMIIAGVVALAANGPITALFVVAGIVVVGQVEGHLLQPLIMGHQVSLHPLVIALGVASGTFLAGILGAVLAVPVIAVAWSIYTTLRPDRAPLSTPDDAGGTAGGDDRISDDGTSVDDIPPVDSAVGRGDTA